jgi:gamma-glutamylcyclotransferase
MQNYFAYGSNLNFPHFQRRCPSATLVDRGVLEGYKLTFPQYDFEWMGGVAGIVPSADSKVEGVIYEISDFDLKNLDELEDISRGDYTRQCMTIKNSLNTPINAWVYIPKGTGESFYKPASPYKRLIISGAVLHKLSQDYINYLSKF